MKKFHLAALAAATAILYTTSCLKDNTAGPGDGPSAEKGEPAEISLTINSAPGTKSAGEGDFFTVEVFVFDGDSNSDSFGVLEGYATAASADITANSATLALTVSTGVKHIYVIANGTIYVKNDVGTESELLEAASRMDDNSCYFVMVGAKEQTLVSSSVNNVAITCRRLVSKVTLGTIVSDFTSPMLRKQHFTVDRIYLMNVPRQVPYVNGGVQDVMGQSNRSTAFVSGDSNYPAGFVGASTGTGTLPYYKYPVPANNNTSNSGFYNWYDASSFSYGETEVEVDETVADLTCYGYEEDPITLSSGQANALAVNHNFYTYPNSSPVAANATTIDNTTKLVIETTLDVGDGYRKFYYPISIPYTQPNYHYTINNVTIKRVGSTNPALPVTKADCSFTVTIADWDTGEIVGQYNNETSEGYFVF